MPSRSTKVTTTMPIRSSVSSPMNMIHYASILQILVPHIPVLPIKCSNNHKSIKQEKLTEVELQV